MAVPQASIQPPRVVPETAIGLAGRTVADYLRCPLAGAVVIHAYERAETNRKTLQWDRTTRSFSYRDVAWRDFARSFELTACSQGVEFDDHSLLSDYAFFSFDPIHHRLVERVLEAFTQKYPSA